MPRFEKYSMLNPCSIFEKIPQPHQKFFQPPRFVVGGFVGSKVCELKNDPVTPINYSNLLGHIFSVFTSIQEPKVKMNISTMTSQYSPKVAQPKSPVETHSISKSKLPTNRIVSENLGTMSRDKNYNNQTISESSDKSWIAVNSVENNAGRGTIDTVEDNNRSQNQTGIYIYWFHN